MTNPKMPVSIAASAFFFNIVNVNVQAFGIFYFTEYAQNWMNSPVFYLGIFIFFVGMFINIRSDYLIVSLIACLLIELIPHQHQTLENLEQDLQHYAL